ncbi:MAG: 7-carboxy-7-deazaguanine synthase QueE [Cytophagaceae bacterium]|nr:7-carboxy-7-deazaguanine synthase QueE [Cytophagaceae bacterium]MDW8455958.1 7-carboxy-7-deazaguanine synthase QueE [Cytophagaceae bacterium]
MELFYTIQGEGYWQGYAAYFIRLGGCDVGCHWCDVKESWPAEAHPKMSPEEISSHVYAHKATIAVVTGGEPLMHTLDPLCDSLRSKNIRTHIETSGAYPISGKWDWVCLSPKKFKLPHPDIYALADELKIIVYNQSDFAFAEQQAARVHPVRCKLYLQPEWSKHAEVMPLIIEYVKKNPQWGISIQLHKFINVP